MLSPTFSPIFSNWVETMASPNTTLAMEYDATATMLNGMMTHEDAQAAFDSMDDASRVMGQWVADNADDMATYPHESEGCAYMVLDDNSAIWAEWDTYGFWYVEIISSREARREMEGKALEYEIEEDAPDSDETHWAQ